ncbi:RNA polymerase sigma factor [Streptomyces sp. NPDC057908]|uniref:RNA polymerase sigma factor n=1 Tax=Streptomyces sp. NPDC057908 TaxID=3346276 RepID=UPI0036EFB7CB
MRTRVRAGEPSAFAELFDSYARTVYNHAFRLTADRATAQDVMAATFMEAWRLRARVDPAGGSLRLWLLGIATNTARGVVAEVRRGSRQRHTGCECDSRTPGAQGAQHGEVARHSHRPGHGAAAPARAATDATARHGHAPSFTTAGVDRCGWLHSLPVTSDTGLFVAQGTG